MPEPPKQASPAPSDPPLPAPASQAPQKVPYLQLFRFATAWDLLLVWLGCLFAAANGVIFPCFSLLFGELLNAFNSPSVELSSTVQRLSLYFLIISLGAGVASLLQTALPMLASERQMLRLRTAYLQALLRQPPSWHDVRKDQGEVSSRLSSDTLLIAGGIGEKLTGGIQHFTTFVAGLIVGFTSSWKLTLVILTCIPLLIFIVATLKNSISRFEKESADAYAKAGDAAGEGISLIKTVSACGGEEHEVRRYETHLKSAEASGISKGFVMAVAVGGIFGSMFLTYAVAMAVGAQFILESREANPLCRYNPLASGCFSGGDVVKCFMAVLIGAFALGQAGPNIAALGSAQAAAFHLWAVMDTQPLIDSQSKEGFKGAEGGAGVRGSIEFRGVSFRYPSREEQVFEDFSLLIPAGQNLALVGESGSGKSTIIALLLRFYDVDGGAVLVDGVDVRQWNVSALRAHIGYVAQDPLLFSASVAENIAMGRAEDAARPPCSQADIEAAARAASAHDFVTALPQGYATVVGTSTTTVQLSGGQRQRICIARALLRDPRVLCLDEATSALDGVSERAVQGAIDALLEGAGRTSIVVAHRLSTVVRSDRICVMAAGRVVEEGVHGELIGREAGVYRRLWELQDVGGGGVGAAAAPLSAADAGAAADATAATAASPSASATTTTTTTTSSPTTTAGTAAAVAASAKPLSWDTLKDTTSLPAVSRWRVLALQRPEWGLMAAALFGAAASGAIQPAFGLIYAQFITIFFQDDSALRAGAQLYCGAFVGFACAVFLATTLRIGMFSLVGERLTRRLRVMAYRAVLRQPMAYFDLPENSSGRLNTRLATDAAIVKSGTGETVGQIYQAGFAILAAMVIAFLASWRLALILLAVMPLQVLGAAYGNISFVGWGLGASKALEEAGHAAVEAMAGLKTIAAFGLQETTMKAFVCTLQGPLYAGEKRAWAAGFSAAFAGFMMFSVYALAFYCGGVFITAGLLDFPSLMRVFLAVTMASQAVGSATAWGPDQARADAATRSIFALLDKVSPIDPLAEEGPVAAVAAVPAAGLPAPTPATAAAAIEFRNVTFTYPSRPLQPVLRDFSLTVAPGEAVGIVGSSGSGKSTVVALLMRWYDPDAGSITMDGCPITGMPVAQLRAALGLVSQEPALFSDSIAYNIGLGVQGHVKLLEPETGVPLSAAAAAAAPGKAAETLPAAADGAASSGPQHTVVAVAAAAAASPSHSLPTIPPSIIAAAASANALGFSSAFEHGLHTHVGVRGSQLSGGQKQRTAIARAIIRQPRVMLLDEATSALDSESEKMVSLALDQLLQEGREQGQSKIVIAHRLSTVRKCDKIVVLERGVVVESGTHDQLMALGGVYRSLADAQNVE